MSQFEFNILIVVLDSAMRQICFDLLAARGAHVDAVADATGARKRLAKDRYSGLVLQEGLLPEAEHPELPTLLLGQETALVRRLNEWVDDTFPSAPRADASGG